MVSSDDTLDIKINNGVKFICRFDCIKNYDDAIKAGKFGLWCSALKWKVHYRSVSVRSNWAHNLSCVLSVVI